MTALPPDVVADLRQENARLQAELRAAQDRQNASAEILRAVASAGGDAGRSLQRIAEITASLFGASSVSLLIADGERWGQTFRVGAGSERIASAIPLAHVAITTQFMPGAVYLENRQVHVPDCEDPAAMARWPGLAPARTAGTRTMSGTPLRREERAIGALIVHRDRLEPFTDEELALQQSFADQAVIAIENARLFNETKEALERQTATADILKVIASSPSDVQPVFEAIATSSNRLIAGLSTAVHRVIDDALHLAAFTRTTPAGDAALQASFPRPLSSAAWGENIRNGETVHIPDVEIEWAGQPTLLEMARLRRFRSLLFVPLLRHGTTIGIISVSRKEAGTFAPHHVLLLQTFADQAVIAIENTRLFNETKEALERQTATADILKVIASSPSDIQPVFEAIATSANRLVGGFSSTVFRFIDGVAHLKAFTPTTPAADQVLQATFPRPFADFPPFRMAQAGEVTQIPDTEALSDALLDISRARGFRSMLFAPLMNDGVSIGLIAVTRVQLGNFTDHHVQLLRTFADQAVIAIENARLFEEVQAKTRDLSEALQQQTATADALKVISRSAFDLQTVLETLTLSAVELSGAKRGAIFLRDGDQFRFQAVSHDAKANPEWVQFLRDHPQQAGRNSAIARAISSGQIVCVPDVLADPEIDMPATALAGIRAVLAVPLIRDGKVEGIMALSRPTAGPFNTRQIDLVQTFADQAVIAIENVRLFEEVQSRTRELTASLDELRTAQDRLVQTEKLASLGQLTAGIAHEIKNPLNFVNNFAALSAELTDELNEVLKPATLAENIREEVDELTGLLKDNLQKVVQHGKRADSIVKNMLLHSREGSGEHRPADINALLDESLNLAYHGARAEKPQFNVTLQRDFDDLAGLVELFPQEITRVFLNLISNGFYAVSKRKTDDGDTDFEPLLFAATRNLGDTVEIRIRDNGTGIPAEVKEKMFNPFFTTKPAGEGTGLGLSMSHDIIVKQHGGRIEVETEPGQFTEFRIVLPRTSSGANKDRGQT
jgi:two-component system NtrC family sensor kinase